MSNKPTVTTKAFNLGPWMRHRTDEHGGMYEPSPDAPHKRADWLEWGDPVNQFGVVWLDAQHTKAERVIDGDGCTAVVLDEAVSASLSAYTQPPESAEEDS